eukprot:477438-Rhodomonas_salina.3
MRRVLTVGAGAAGAQQPVGDDAAGDGRGLRGLRLQGDRPTQRARPPAQQEQAGARACVLVT